MTASKLAAPPWSPMRRDQREQFERDGYLVLPGVLSTNEVAYYAEALDRVHERAVATGQIHPDGPTHQLSAVTSCPPMVGLIDHRRAFPLVWSVLGWNIHVYHSHLDVHPPVRDGKPFWWHWHQDGGRQNRELETSPRPRLSVKLAFWLSDVSESGRGNLMVIPGSHRQDWLDGPPRRDVVWPAPRGAVPVLANPGDAVFFDRRIWHARSDNHSNVVRKVVFIGYTYRWISIRDDVAALPNSPMWSGLNPLQRQLLGGVGNGIGDHQWGHDPHSTPLYGELASRGLLDEGHPTIEERVSG